MLANKRSKMSRLRGSRFHGWGQKRRHRGAGHRGGVGMGGAKSSKKPTVLRDFEGKYLGKSGFFSVRRTENEVISLKYLNDSFDKLVKEGVIEKKGSEFVFDSAAHGYDKVLGTGVLTKKLTVVCDKISELAKKKIEDAGGKVVLSESAEEA